MKKSLQNVKNIFRKAADGMKFQDRDFEDQPPSLKEGLDDSKVAGDDSQMMQFPSKIQ